MGYSVDRGADLKQGLVVASGQVCRVACGARWLRGWMGGPQGELSGYRVGTAVRNLPAYLLEAGPQCPRGGECGRGLGLSVRVLRMLSALHPHPSLPPLHPL